MSLFVVHDLQRPAPLAIRGLYFAQTEDVTSVIPEMGDATALSVLAWTTPRASTAALLPYRRNLPGDVTAAAAGYGDATAIQVQPWYPGIRPMARRPWSAPVDTGNAPPPAASMGDATAISVIVWRAWQNLARWRGLYENTAQDIDGPNFNYGSTADYFLQYNPSLQSPMSRFLYQNTPAQDATAPTVDVGYEVTFTARRAKPAPMRHNFALHMTPPQDDSGQQPIGDPLPQTELRRWTFHHSSS